MIDKLKIVLQCRSLGVGKGGVERVATEMANEMVERGHEIHIGYRDNGSPAYYVDENINLIPYTDIDKFRTDVREINPDVFFAFYVNHLLIEDYSIVHGTKIPFAIQECSNPTRICQNNWKTEDGIYGKAYWEREVVASAASCIRITMHSYLKSFPKYIQNRVIPFSNPASPKIEGIQKQELNKKRNTIININGFKSNKNLISLVKAFARISNRYPEWYLKVVGKLPQGIVSHEKEVLDYIKTEGIGDRVIINGPTDNMYKEYKEAQIHVISSLSEGCPTVVLEAMSVGIPSIGYSDCSGTNELIVHEQNGLLADPSDRVGSLEQELRRLMDNNNYREELGNNALKDSASFHPKRIYDLWENLFYKAAEDKKNPQRLLNEQMAVDPEKALHSRRMRAKLMKSYRSK